MKLYSRSDGHGQHGGACRALREDFRCPSSPSSSRKSAAASRAARRTVDAARLDGDERPPRVFGERPFGAIALASLVEVDPEIISQSLVRAFTARIAENRVPGTVGPALSGTTATRHPRRHVRRARGRSVAPIVVFDALDDDPPPRLADPSSSGFFKAPSQTDRNAAR